MKIILMGPLLTAQCLGLSAFAQLSSDKPVRIVDPFSAGGLTEVLARVLAPKLPASLKRTVTVDNRVGATGMPLVQRSSTPNSFSACAAS